MDRNADLGLGTGERPDTAQNWRWRMAHHVCFTILYSNCYMSIGLRSALTRDVACEFMLAKTYVNLDKDDFNVAVAKMLLNGGFIWCVTKHLPFLGRRHEQNRFLSALCSKSWTMAQRPSSNMSGQAAPVGHRPIHF